MGWVVVDYVWQKANNKNVSVSPVDSEKNNDFFFILNVVQIQQKNDNTNFLSDKCGSTNVVLHNCACMKKINGHEMTEVEWPFQFLVCHKQ